MVRLAPDVRNRIKSEAALAGQSYEQFIVSLMDERAARSEVAVVVASSPLHVGPVTR